MGQHFLRNILFGLVITLAVDSSLSDVNIKKVLEQPLVTPGPNIVATSLLLTFPPGDEGAPPHHHSGPLVGYVLEGFFLFQVANEKPRIIPAGGTFYETDGITHVWGANASDNSTCQVLASLFGRPGEPILTLDTHVLRNSRAEALAQAQSNV